MNEVREIFKGLQALEPFVMVPTPNAPKLSAISVNPSEVGKIGHRIYSHLSLVNEARVRRVTETLMGTDLFQREIEEKKSRGKKEGI